MYNPTLRPSAPKQRVKGSSSTLRNFLLVWAVLRWAVSLFFTFAVLLSLAIDVKEYDYIEDHNAVYYKRLLFDLFAVLVQLVELGMLVIFIRAGMQRNARLYRAYYHYYILTLIIYNVTVTLGHIVFSNDVYFLGELYLSFHFVKSFLTKVSSDYFCIAFLLTIAIDIGLQVFLLISLRKLIQRYSPSASRSANV